MRNLIIFLLLFCSLKADEQKNDEIAQAARQMMDRWGKMTTHDVDNFRVKFKPGLYSKQPVQNIKMEKINGKRFIIYPNGDKKLLDPKNPVLSNKPSY